MKNLLLLSLLFSCACGQSTSYSVIDQSCHVSSSSMGTLIRCPSSSTLITNDTDLTISAKPFCPLKPAPNGFSESYFVNTDGTLWAILDTGSAMGVYLTYIKPGTYETSDGANCLFKVNNDNSITILN